MDKRNLLVYMTVLLFLCGATEGGCPNRIHYENMSTFCERSIIPLDPSIDQAIICLIPANSQVNKRTLGFDSKQRIRDEVELFIQPEVPCGSTSTNGHCHRIAIVFRSNAFHRFSANVTSVNLIARNCTSGKRITIHTITATKFTEDATEDSNSGREIVDCSPAREQINVSDLPVQNNGELGIKSTNTMITTLTVLATFSLMHKV